MKEANQNQHKEKGHYPYGGNYESSTSPNAQNMRQTHPDMPLESDNARVDLSADPLSGLDEQNDTGSCTGAEFGGYGRYSNGYKGNPKEVKSQNSIHSSQNPTASVNAAGTGSGSSDAVDARKRNIVGLCLALAVSAAAIGAAGWLSGGELLVTDPGSSGAETAETPSFEENAPAGASQENIPKTENFVLDYEEPEPSVPDTPSRMEPSTAEPKVPEQTETAALSEAVNETAEIPQEAAAPAGSEAVSTPATPESFILPVEGAVTNPYSQGELVKSKTLGEWRTHDGVDLAAAEGTSVVSIADGLVEVVREDARWGNTIEVNHGDYTAFYYGLGDEIQVKAGDAVTAGQALAEAGNSSLVEAEEVPHVHLGIKKGDEWVDPAVLLGIDGTQAESPSETE